MDEPDVPLYIVLKNGYNKDILDKQATLTPYGYVFDIVLSNDNQQVYYNEDKKKIIYNVSGTHNLKDWMTDLCLVIGVLKKTKRYKEADTILKTAKTKYNVDVATVTGHSLGAIIAQYISGTGDMVVGFDGAFIGQDIKHNQIMYRTTGDIVSIVGMKKKHMRTLKNNNYTHFRPISNIFKAHDLKQIKYVGIMI